MKIKIILIVSIVCLIILAIFAIFFKDHRILKIDGKTFLLSEAKTENEKTKGLSDIKFLSGQSGMIFYFDKAEIQSFWMKNTLIPLQIIFIDNCKIVDEQEMTVEKDPANPQKIYKSAAVANIAIELNENSVSENLIGTKIKQLCN